MENRKFSIIVPVYNVEKFLKRCVFSLVGQQNAEIILVDDGSIDKSGKLCDEFARNYSNIRVIHQENGGLSCARNSGIRIASGEYIVFVDSDDYVESDLCRRLDKALSTYGNVDIIAYDAWKETEAGREKLRRISADRETVQDGKEYLVEHYRNRNMNVEAWLHAFRRRFLADNGFYFKEGIFHEDVEFSTRVFLKAKRILEISDVLYHYIIRENSISTQKDKTKNICDLFETLKQQNDLAEQQEPELRKWMKSAILNSYLNMIQDAGMHRKKYRWLLDKRFLLGKAATPWEHFRVLLCYVNVGLYYQSNLIFKRIRRWI